MGAFYRQPYSRANGLKGTGRSVKKTRFSPAKRLTRIKYAAPTAKRQRSQIYSNARVIASHQRYINQHKVFCDYQLVASQLPPVGGSGWTSSALTSFNSWRQVLRVDDAAFASPQTYIRNAVINMRYILNNCASVAFSVFIVTPRRYATQIDTTALVVGSDYIENGVDDGTNIRLNPALFKVHYSKYLTLTANRYGIAPVADQNVGNPNTTWRKAQVSLPLKMVVRKPRTTLAPGTHVTPKWPEIDFEDLPYYHKYYVMIYWQVTGQVVAEAAPEVTVDSLFTTINTD